MSSEKKTSGNLAERRQLRASASLPSQCRAFLQKNLALQRRRWKTNAAVVLTPIFFCVLLYGLSLLIENELGSHNFRCGCRCTSCFDWVLVTENGAERYEYQFFETTPEKPCLRSSNCQRYDRSTCGVQYSKDRQAPFCAIEEPPIYPPFVKVPYLNETEHLIVQSRPLPYTGRNKDLATTLMNRLIPSDQSTAEQLLEVLGTGSAIGFRLGTTNLTAGTNRCSPTTASSVDDATTVTMSADEEDGFDSAQMRRLRQGAEASAEGNGMLSEELLDLVNRFTHTLSDSGVVLGTPSSSSRSLFLEPALLPPSRTRPLYLVLPDCTALTPVQLNGLKRASCETEMLIGRPLKCVSFAPDWRPTAQDIDYDLYCRWRNAPCFRDSTESSWSGRPDNIPVSRTIDWMEVRAIYDWKTTRNRHFLVDIRINDTIQNDPTQPPLLQRYNAPLNLAANAFLRQQMNDTQYEVRLYGLKGMPKPETRFMIDFSTLLGPVFFLWLLQMLLPINVHHLMHEKQHDLRIMMKMQGLDDRVYYFVTYLWQFFIYSCFITVFLVAGSWLGLGLLTKNQLSLQLVFYALWGQVMIAWGFWMTTLFKDQKSAVHSTIVWVIGSGLMGTFLLAPFIMRGPSWIAHALQTMPSFGLYRGVWELAQYSFLASYNAGDGLTWNKLDDTKNGMIRVFVTFAVEWLCFLLGAWYNDQVYSQQERPLPPATVGVLGLR